MKRNYTSTVMRSDLWTNEEDDTNATRNKPSDASARSTEQEDVQKKE